MMAGFSAESIKPLILPFVLGMDAEIAPMLTEGFDPKQMVDAKAMRAQVQELMVTKMEMLTPPMVHPPTIVYFCTVLAMHQMSSQTKY